MRPDLHQIRISSIALLALGVVTCSPAAAKIRPATPANLVQVFGAAAPGDTIALEPGDYEGVSLGGRTFKPELTIDASKARMSGWYLRRIGGLTLKGGVYYMPPPTVRERDGHVEYGRALRLDNSTSIKVMNARFVGPAAPEKPIYEFGEGYGIFVVGGSDYEITSNMFVGFRSGLVFSRVSGFRISKNLYLDMRSDGMQFGETRNGIIEDNTCRGTRIRDKEHPDCVQMWSRATSPPTADIIIRRNLIEGGTQGVGMFNHIRDGVNDGGFDRILIEDNDINISYPQGIALYEGRDSIVRNNRVRTQPGSRFVANINVAPDVVRCGNVIAAGAGKRGVTDPPCK